MGKTSIKVIGKYYSSLNMRSSGTIIKYKGRFIKSMHKFEHFNNNLK